MKLTKVLSQDISRICSSNANRYVESFFRSIAILNLDYSHQFCLMIYLTSFSQNMRLRVSNYRMFISNETKGIWKEKSQTQDRPRQSKNRNLLNYTTLITPGA
jgi:hypothetical protein